jgi:hypothetical protein
MHPVINGTLNEGLRKLPEIFLINIFKIPASLFFSETELILLHFFEVFKDRRCLKISRVTIENETLNVKIKYTFFKAVRNSVNLSHNQVRRQVEVLDQGS